MHFRVWAPRAARVEVDLGDRRISLDAEREGYHAGVVPAVGAGTRYTYRLDEGPGYPDPASRFQPEGPHGPSEVIDPRPFPWTDDRWLGVPGEGQVLYEMHVGTFTTAGTWEPASRELPELARAGITLVEVLPAADFVGDFGWGYDGVDLFAPTRLYGRPDDFRALVDRAHAVGLGVILDVVYNHLGPDGNYLGQFASDYFSRRHRTDWGPAINFDGTGSGPVREFFVANAGYWIEEFHLDGLRLDATQDIHDDSPEHVLTAIARSAREKAGRRTVFLVAVFRTQGTGGIDGAVLGPEALALRLFGVGPHADDRLLCLNLGRDLAFPTGAEPLLAPPEGTRWALLWSSEAIRYGGAGTPELDPEAGWLLPGHAALVFGASR